MATKIGPKTVSQRDRSKALVFCVDAAHSDSYGGEPADNLFADPNNFGGADWNVKNGTWAAYSDPGPHGNGCYGCTATDSDPYAYSNYVRSVSTGNVTFSCWVKGVGGTVGMGGDIRINNGSSGGQATIANTTVNYTITGNWQRVSVTQNCTGAGTIKVGVEAPNSATAGHVVLVSDPQLEQGQATTPFTATSRTAANAIKNISGVGAQGTTLTGTFATYGLGGLFRPTTRKVLASEDSNRGHIGAVYWDFDGSDEYINLGQATDGTGGLSLKGYESLSICQWVNLDSVSSYYRTFYENQTDAGNNYRVTFLGDSSNFGFYIYTSSGTAAASKGSAIATGAWTHIAGTYDGANIRLYINGEQTGSASLTGAVESSTGSNGGIAIAVRKSGSSLDQYVNGKVATTSVWSSGLTAKEIKDIYIAQKGRFGK